MTKEQTIKHLKLMQSGARNAIRFSKNDKKISEEERKEDIEIYQDQLEALDMAIKALEQQTNDCMIFGTKENCFGGATENECEHCDYKIQKLEQQPNDDCVSRQAVHNMLEDIPIVDTDKWFNWLQKACLRLADLPPVTPTQSWIPIVTREPTEEEKEYYFEQNGEELCYMIDCPMPDNGQEVLVSVGSFVSEDVFNEDFWNFENCDIENVDAWMPLPQPYEEKRGNENEIYSGIR